MSVLTLLDVAKINGADGGLMELADEAVRLVPEIAGMTFVGGKLVQVPGVGAARSIKGTQYKTLIRTALPTFQFRDANQGVTPSNSVYENRLVSCFIANPRSQTDKAVADANEDGPEALIAEEAQAVLSSTFMGLGAQFYYGRNTNGDTKGHPGLIDAYDSTNMVVDAGGTTDNVSSSAWAVRFGPQNVQWVLGQNGKLAMDEVRVQTLPDPNDSTKFLTYYIQELLAWVGVQVKNKYSIARIKKLTTDSGKGLTDARLGSLLALFPVGIMPDAIFCTRRSLEQLRQSRTATNDTGKEAETPTNFQGVPLIPTDSIKNTELLAS